MEQNKGQKFAHYSIQFACLQKLKKNGLITVDKLVPNITNTFSVYLRMENGAGEIETGDCIASISGQAMAAAAAWDGKIAVEESIGRFMIGGGLNVKGYADAIQIETMELVRRSYSDSIGRVMIGAFSKPVEMEGTQ